MLIPVIDAAEPGTSDRPGGADPPASTPEAGRARLRKALAAEYPGVPAALVDICLANAWAAAAGLHEGSATFEAYVGSLARDRLDAVQRHPALRRRTRYPRGGGATP